MSFQHTHRLVVTRPGADDLQYSASHSSGAAPNLDESFTDATNQLVTWSADVSKIKALAIVVDGACTIETNNSTTPDDTLTFAAAGRYEWTEANRATEDLLLLGTDVTALYVTCVGTVRVQISCLMDPTP